MTRALEKRKKLHESRRKTKIVFFISFFIGKNQQKISALSPANVIVNQTAQNWFSGQWFA